MRPIVRASCVAGIVLSWMVACSVDHHGQFAGGAGGAAGASSSGKGGAGNAGSANKGGSSSTGHGGTNSGGAAQTGGGSGAVAGDDETSTAGGGAAGGTSEGSGGAEGGEDSGGVPSVGGAQTDTKKAPGALCSTATECSSGLCGGRCCNPGQACTCTQPSAQNMLKNPGFDNDISGWNQEAGPGGFSWQPDDYEKCPFSGSAYISTPAGYSQRLWQCVAISPHASYDFGVRYHTAEGAYAHCDVDIYPGANCTGTATNVAAGLWLNVGWGPGGNDVIYKFDSGLSASAMVSCYNGADFGVDAAFYIDQIYLTPAPAAY